jgi:HlyD family secretion protein
MKSIRLNKILSLAIALLLVSGIVWWRVNAGNAADKDNADAASPASSAGKASLTVTTISPAIAEWPVKLSATGTIEAWQEALIGSEVNGLRLTEIKAQVGETVRRGQVLATFSNVTVKADLAQAQAAVAEAEAMLVQAKTNADRTRKMQAPGVISAQQISEYLTAEQAASARLESAKAQLLNQRTRLEQTQLLAPDDGLISSRTATLGSVVSVGQELFRLILLNRLEWRAEVTAAELPSLRAGQPVTITAPGEVQATGTVRMVAPTVDSKTRMALVYVDVPSNTGLKAGMFARGHFELGRTTAMILPQTAIVQREGFSYVYRVGADNKVAQLKVEIGRRLEDQVEITQGLEPQTRVAAIGAAFLADGDTVRVVDPVQTLTRSEP